MCCVPTIAGRGFGYHPVPFTQLYAMYGRTHLQPGVGLLLMLLALAVLLAPQGYGVAAYAAVTWPMWIHTMSLLLAPFWFAPEVRTLKPAVHAPAFFFSRY